MHDLTFNKKKKLKKKIRNKTTNRKNNIYVLNKKFQKSFQNYKNNNAKENMINVFSNAHKKVYHLLSHYSFTLMQPTRAQVQK